LPDPGLSTGDFTRAFNSGKRYQSVTGGQGKNSGIFQKFHK